MIQAFQQIRAPGCPQWTGKLYKIIVMQSSHILCVELAVMRHCRNTATGVESQGSMGAWRGGIAACVLMAAATAGHAAACVAPEAPFLPNDAADIRAYADLLRLDFEAYFAEAQAYFWCMEQERQRVFREAQDVTEAYGRMIEVVGE